MAPKSLQSFERHVRKPFLGSLQAVGLPLDAQGLIIAVDRVLDMCRTAVNVWSDSCGCAVLARFEQTPEAQTVPAPTT
jgi:Na+/H+-dicarboxylate symporter